MPVFALAAIGYASVRSGLLDRAASKGLATFVFNIAIPVLLFRSLASASVPDGSPWLYFLTYLAAICVAWALSMALMRFIAGRGWRASVIAGVAGGFSNLVLVGIPLIERAFGPEALALHFLLLGVHLPFMMALATFLMEFAARADGADDSPVRAGEVLVRLFRNFSTNPIIIGILAGVAWRLTGWDLPLPAVPVLDMIARTAGPLALLSLGMGLVEYSIRGNWQPAVGVSFIALVIMPTVALIAGLYVFDLSPLWLKVTVLAAACPTGVNAYLFATYFNRAEGFASSSIVIAALGSLITLPFWLGILAGY